MKYKILLSDRISDTGIKIFGSDPDIDVDVNAGIAQTTLTKIIQEYHAFIVRSRIQVTLEVINAALNLKVIGRAGVGFENIDVDAATKRNIVVMNTPDANRISVAEHTLGLMLALARNIPKGNVCIREGKWIRDELMGSELYGKKLGIIGLGRIGRDVAVRASAFGMRILAYDPLIDSEEFSKLNVKRVDLKFLLVHSDFVTIHVPLNNNTKDMLGIRELKLMKPLARLINIARGGVVNEAALYQTLNDKQIAGAALDVFENEPPVGSPLLSLENIVLTPHIGAATLEAKEKVGSQIAKQVIDALKGVEYRNVVNKEVLVKLRG